MRDCNIVVSEFEPQQRNYVHFRTNTREKCVNFLMYGLILPLLSFFFKDNFGIKKLTKVDMQLNNKKYQLEIELLDIKTVCKQMTYAQLNCLK